VKNVKSEIFKWILIIVVVMVTYGWVRRDKLINTVNRALPAQEAAVLNGMVLGDKRGFEKEFYKELKNSGLVHLVVVSGSNLMLLSGNLIGLFSGWLGRKKTIIGTLFLAWGYAALVGWELPVIRALLMVTLLYLAQLLGKKFNLIRGLVVTVVVMFLAAPKIIFELSFWLSLMAFIGVVTTKETSNQKQVTRIIQEIVWINLWTLPLIAVTIGTISWMTPVTNVLVILGIEIITGVGMVGMILGSGLVLNMIYPLLKYMVWVVETGGQWGVINWKFNWWMVIGWYLLLIYYLIKKPEK